MKATHMPSIVALRFGVALLSLGFFGCASALQFGTPREAMAKRVNDTAAQVAEVNGRIDAAQRALDDIANHPATDLKRQFDVYSDALNKLESANNKLRGDVEAMEAEGREYLVAWDRQIATIQDQDLRNRTAERRNDVSQRIDELHSRYITARDALSPVLNRLQEIQTALKVDLTSAGIQSVGPTARDTDDLNGARNALNDLSEAFRRANVSLAAATPAGGNNNGR